MSLTENILLIESRIKLWSGNVWGLEYLVGSVLGSLSCLMQCHGFKPPLGRIFPVERICLLELTWVLNPFPKNSFG